MSGDALQFLGVVFTGLVVLGGYLIAQRQDKKKTSTDVAQGLSDTAQKLIDQLQEERTGTQARLDRMESDNRDRDERERIRDDYIQELRNHIRAQLPPPPPPWPEGLRRG